MTERPEEWKDVPGYEGIYLVSNKGRVKSQDRRGRFGVFRKGKVLSQSGRKGPYPTVNLSKNGSVKPSTVHSLVMAAFSGTPPQGMEVRHLNGDPEDNRLENLEHGTRYQNVQDQRGHGTFLQGEGRWNAKLNKEKVEEIHRLRKEGALHKEIAAIFGVSRQTIGEVLRGNRWAHVFSGAGDGGHAA